LIHPVPIIVELQVSDPFSSREEETVAELGVAFPQVLDGIVREEGVTEGRKGSELSIDTNSLGGVIEPV
jgi:hypothetical protein